MALSAPDPAAPSRSGVPAPPAAQPARDAGSVPVPTARTPDAEEGAPGVPASPAVGTQPHDKKMPDLDFTSPSPPAQTTAWQRVPASARMGLILVAGLVFAAGLFLMGRFIALGGGRLEPVKGSYIKPGAGFIIEMPPRGWYGVTRQPAGSSVAGEFHRGWTRHAPVTLRILRSRISLNMPRAFTDETVNLLEPYFIKRTERILVQDGQGFAPGKVSAVPGMGLRDGVMLEGKALPPNADPIPVVLVFVFSGNQEFILLFMIPGENPEQYDQEIKTMIKTFRAD